MAEKPQANSKPQHTQGARRIKYGLNVSVAVVAAAALAVLLNWIAYREYVRIDMTASRRYSLSEQTEKLLGRLDKDYELVTLFRASNEHLERISDLVEEYARYNGRIEARHINPTIDVAERNAFYERLLKRYEDQIEPIESAVRQGRDVLTTVMGDLPKLNRELSGVADHPDLNDQQIQQTSATVVRAFDQFENQLKTMNESLDKALGRELPNYNSAQSSIKSVLTQIDQNLLSPAIVQFQSGADRQGVPPAVQDTLLRVAERMQQQQTKIKQAIETLNNAETPSRYNVVRGSLTSQQSLVVMSPTRVQVIPASSLYREADPQVVRSEGEPELQFLGEEKITGAIVSMQLDQPPMIVFCYTGQRPALGRRGQYTQVAERLRSANFDVQQWNPTGGGRQQMMQQMRGGGGGPPPEAEQGQKTVWIVLPSQPQNARMAMMQQGNQAQQQVLQHISERLTQSDSAMFMLSPSPMSRFSGPDPLSQMLTTWGIEPQLDRVIMREVQVSQQTQTTRRVEVTSWPDELPITRALAGMPALFVQSSPLKLNKPDEMDVTHWALANLSGKRVWAEDDLSSAEAVRNASYDAETAKQAYTVGVAAESGDKRMIVVADPAWASDPITTAGQIQGRIMPGMAEMTGAAFPGNGELFVNSVYWLAGLDELIAASPRTQDIRRIRSFSNENAYVLDVYRGALLAGMPALVLLIGIGVWLVRRMG